MFEKDSGLLFKKSIYLTTEPNYSFSVGCSLIFNVCFSAEEGLL